MLAFIFFIILNIFLKIFRYPIVKSKRYSSGIFVYFVFQFI